MERKTLSRILQRIEGPVAYACQGNFSRLPVLKNLGRYVSRQIQNNLEAKAQDRISLRLRTVLELFRGYDLLPLNERVKRLLRAQALIGELQAVLSPDDRSSGDTRPGLPGDEGSARHAKVNKAGTFTDAVPGPVQKIPEEGSKQKGPPGRSPNNPVPWEMNVQLLKGIGPKRAELLRKVGVKTLEDLFYCLPWRYEDRRNLKKISQLVPEENQTLCARVCSARLRITRWKKFKILEVIAGDDTGSIIIKWFNQPYLRNVFKQGQRLMLSGRVKRTSYGGRPEMENPHYELLGPEQPPGSCSPVEELIHTGRIVPVYHETAGLSSRIIRSLVMSVLETWGSSISEILPREILDRNGLSALGVSLRGIHFPAGSDSSEAGQHDINSFRRRIVFDDLFLLQLGLACKRRELQQDEKGVALISNGKIVNRFLAQLPYPLTGAQSRVIGEIRKDMGRFRPMNRLVQGDVGCGKTLVAVMALMSAVENSYQVAFMAPTEILAEQHYFTLKSWLSDLGLHVVLLTSGLARREQRKANEMISKGEADLVVGTHALIEERIRFKKLGMVVIDEQHKFGVLQRGALVKKGYHPDVLVMTATPIPRTLALTVYGDMDVSVIDEMPPGRRPVDTVLLGERERPEAYQVLSRELSAGRQAYVVYPLVEESEKTDLRAATQMARLLKEGILSRWRVALLHGRMSTQNKEEIMIQFKAREIDVLVATTVIEVGIDVPNATVLVVEHAERFGLAQLHQLRGRVGRGQERSVCFLVASNRATQEARRRLEVMVKYRDGFAIAEQDLLIRGPGEFWGTRQSGIPELRVANLIRDRQVLEDARREAFALLERDPMLKLPEHQPLRNALYRRWQGRLDLMMVH